jgi:CheY-like chemotaxis protein
MKVMDGQHKNFLLVEDEANDRFLMEREFKQSLAYGRLDTASDGVEGIEYLEGKGQYADRSKYPLPDAILLDLKMPRMDGFQFLEWLRSRGPLGLRRLPVIVLSSSILRQDMERAYALGADSYVTKPQDLEGLHQFVEKLTAHRSKEMPPPNLNQPGVSMV